MARTRSSQRKSNWPVGTIRGTWKAGFSPVVHGDVEGAENVRRSLYDWLCSLRLLPAGPDAQLDRYIGYWKPYATSHAELDADEAVQEEVRNAARVLLEAVLAIRSGQQVNAGKDLNAPREK